MNATKRSKSKNIFYTYLFLFVAKISAQQNSITFEIALDSTFDNQEKVFTDIIDSTDTLFIDEKNINQPPKIINPIPPILMNEDEIFIVNLNSFYSYVSDPDDSINNIQWTFLEGNNTSTSLINNKLHLQSTTNWHGVDSIQFVISD